MIENKKEHTDELYTITLFDRSETGEQIPQRAISSEKIFNEKIEPATASDIITQSVNVTAEFKSQAFNDSFPARSEEGNISTDSRQRELIIPPTKEQRRQDFLNKHGLPPVLNSSSLIARQAYYSPPVQAPLNKKSFIEQAREYADITHEKTARIPFMCYWPSYEYMSPAQLEWYFYMRSCIRNSEYIETDLSYIFVYIYELINQVGVSSSDDGLDRLIKIWVNYRKTYNKLDRYLTDWVGDYISYYACDAERVIDLLKQESLFLLMPTDMLADYYFKNDMELPIELISRFSDYKLYESEFIKGEHGNLFTDYLAGLIDAIRKHMNKQQEGSFEKRDLLLSRPRLQKKLPFQRAVFNNPDNIRIDTYPPYEQHKPFRLFITAVIKDFENQLRILTKYRGRLRPDSLPEDIKNLCKSYAKDAYKGSQPEQRVEISIDRNKLLALMQDSDEVRKRLIEGNYEYEEYRPKDTMQSYTDTENNNDRQPAVASSTASASDTGDNDLTSKINNNPQVGDINRSYDNTPVGDINQPEDNIPASSINRSDYKSTTGSISLSSDNTPAGSISLSSDNTPASSINRSYDSTPTGDINRSYDSTPTGDINRSYDKSAPSNINNLSENPPVEESSSFRTELSSLQQRILDYLLAKETSCSASELSTAFPAVLVGVEIDKINDIALEHIGDLLICFEADSWTIIEDYIDEL